MAFSTIRLTLRRQTEGGLTKDAHVATVDFRPGLTTVRELLQKARHRFHAQNLCIKCTGDTQAALQHIYSGRSERTTHQQLQQDDDQKALNQEDAAVVSNTIEDVQDQSTTTTTRKTLIVVVGKAFQEGDTAVIVPVRKEGPNDQDKAFHLYKVIYPSTKVASLGDLLGHKLGMYHAMAGVELIDKADIRTIVVKVMDHQVRFQLPSFRPETSDEAIPVESDSKNRMEQVGSEEVTTVLLMDDSLKHLHAEICTAFGLSTTASRHRLSLFSPTDDQRWFEEGWERSSGLCVHELGLAGPVLEGSFDELSLVLVKTSIAGKTIALRTRLSDTVEKVKAKLHGIIGIPPEQLELTFQNAAMEDHHSLAQHGVWKRSVMKLGLSLPKADNNVEGATAGAAEVQPKKTVSLTLILPNNRVETVEVDKSSSVSQLHECASNVKRGECGLVPCVSIEEASTSSSIENKCHQQEKKREGSSKEAPPRDIFVRANQTVNNAIQSILSSDRENKIVCSTDDQDFGEI